MCGVDADDIRRFRVVFVVVVVVVVVFVDCHITALLKIK